MEVPPARSTMSNPLVASLQTSALPGADTHFRLPDSRNNDVGVTSSGSLVGQPSTFMTEVLPSQGFTLVNLDLDQLQLDQTSEQQLKDGNNESDEFDDGVNLVVKGSWWWCKDCKIKQKFGLGESIEDHLQNKHNITNKTEEMMGQQFTKRSQIEQYSQEAPKEPSNSDGVTSVYTVPEDSVTIQDQTVETLIVIDGTTTVQVITKHTGENSVFSSPSEEGNKTVFPPEISSASGLDFSSSCTHVEGVLPQMKPIPVIPALPFADSKPPSLHPSSASSSVKLSEKESKSAIVKIPENSSSDTRSPQQCSEDSRRTVAVTVCRDVLGSGRSNIQTDYRIHAAQDDKLSPMKTTEMEPKSPVMKILDNILPETRPPYQCTVDSGRNLVVGKLADATENGRTKHKLETKTSAVENNRSQMSRKPAHSTVGSSAIVTRRKTYFKNGKNIESIQLKDCSVHVTRMSSGEMTHVNDKLAGSPSELKSRSLPAKIKKHMKGTKKSISLKSSITVKNSLKKTSRVSQSLQQLTHSDKQSFGTDIQLVADISEKHTSFGMKTRRSSGRKIRKPARYLTGSESEEEIGKTEQYADQEMQHSIPVVRLCTANPYPSSSNIATSCQKPNSPQNPTRCSRKRRISSAADNLEPEKSDSQRDTTSDLGCRKAKDEKYSCEDCGRKFRTENKLYKHSKLYAGQTMQQCSVCDVKLHNQDLLNVHMYHIHLTKESTSCITCGKTLGSKKNLLNHLLTHRSSEGQTVANLIKDSCAVHQCSICEETIIIGEGRVEKHYLTHEKPSMLKCQKCGQSFHHKKELYNHLKTHGNHVEVWQQITEQSNQSDSKTGSTNSTEQDNHSADPETLTCVDTHEVQDDDLHTDERVIAESVQKIMQYEESSSKSVDNQLTLTFIASDPEEAGTEVDQSIQMGRPLIYCEQCNIQFTTKKLLYQHLKIHGAAASGTAATKDNTLSGCRKQESVSQPIDLTAGVPFGIPCSLVQLECQGGHEDFVIKSFTTSPEGLVDPKQMHYSCALCEREFESESKAMRHVNRFSQQQTIIKCNLCPCRFHNLDLFNVHYVYIHQHVGAASCMTCKMDFSNKGDFLTHLGNSPLSHPLSHKLGFKTFIQDACGTVTCTICRKNMWNYPLNIANHTRMHRSLSCPICQQALPYKYALFIHLQIHADSRNLSLNNLLSETERQQIEQIEKLHRIVCEVESNAFVENSGKFYCAFCKSEVLCTRKNIHQHLDLHARKLLYNIREGRYFCPDCGEDIAVTDQSILNHMHSHGHSEIQFVCIFCSETFDAFDIFKEHELKKHWLNVYFEKSMCEVCGKEFVSRQQFQKHIKLHEEKQGLFSCSHCKQTFRFESKLQRHITKHKRGSYACQFCGKLYITKISLDRHEQVDHIGIKDLKHKCKLCDAQFINATHLRDHVTNKHTSGASYRCQQCPLGFKHLSTYARHKRVVHDGDTPYVCQECGEKFPVKKSLQSHMIIHTGINPFQCPACPKTFGLERTMKEHFDFVHQGIQKFVCSYCGNKFPRKRSLKRHMVTCRMSGLPQVELAMV